MQARGGPGSEVSMKRKKRKGWFSKLIILLVVLNINVFTAIAIWVQIKTGSGLPDELTKWFFLFWGTEMLSLAGVKVAKVIKPFASAMGASDESIKEEMKDGI